MDTIAEGYLTLTEGELRQLRVERVRALELDHARTTLLAAETAGTPEEPGSRSQLVEIERRILIHVTAAEPEPGNDEQRPGDDPDDGQPAAALPDPAYLPGAGDEKVTADGDQTA